MWVLNLVSSALVRDKREDTHRAEGNEDEDRDWSDTDTNQGSQGMLKATGSWKRQGRILSEPPEGIWPADILILNF